MFIKQGRSWDYVLNEKGVYITMLCRFVVFYVIIITLLFLIPGKYARIGHPIHRVYITVQNPF